MIDVKHELKNILNSINHTKVYLFADDEELYQSINNFTISHCLIGVDTIEYAQLMNRYGVDAKLLYDFYFYALPKRRRYNKWVKHTEYDPKDVEIIQHIYGYSYIKAIDALRTISKENLTKLKDEYDY